MVAFTNLVLPPRHQGGMFGSSSLFGGQGLGSRFNSGPSPKIRNTSAPPLAMAFQTTAAAIPEPVKPVIRKEFPETWIWDTIEDKR